MNARIYCTNCSEEDLQEALTLGNYSKGDPSVKAIGYQLYQYGSTLLLEFETPFDYCQMTFLVMDLLDVTRAIQNSNVKGFIDTNKNSRITDFMKGQRACLYLAAPHKKALREDPNSDLEGINIVIRNNEHYKIDIENFFAYPSKDATAFAEPQGAAGNYKLIGKGEYLYEEGDFESEFLEDLKEAGQ